MVLEKSRRSTIAVRIASAVAAFLGEGSSERAINTTVINADVATAAQTGQRPRWDGAGIRKAGSPGGWGGVWTEDAAFVAANKIGRNSRGTYLTLTETRDQVCLMIIPVTIHYDQAVRLSLGNLVLVFLTISRMSQTATYCILFCDQPIGFEGRLDSSFRHSWPPGSRIENRRAETIIARIWCHL